MSLTIPPYKGQGWTDGSEPALSAETLNAVDAGITANSKAINAIANAVVNQIVNDPGKIASIAVAYVLQQQINALNSNLADVRSDMGGVKFAYISGGTAGLKTTDSNGKIYIEFSKYAPNEYYNLFVQGAWVGSNVLNVVGKYSHGFDVELRNNAGAVVPNETITFDWFAVKFG